MNKRQAKKVRKLQIGEFDKLQKEILIKENEYLNSLDKDLNGNETILEELKVLKKKRSKLIAIKKQEVMKSYKKRNNNLQAFDGNHKEPTNNTTVLKMDEKTTTHVKENKGIFKNKSILKPTHKMITHKMPKKDSFINNYNKAIIDSLSFDSNKCIIDYHEKGISKTEVYDISCKKENIKNLATQLNSMDKKPKKFDINAVLSEFDKKHNANSVTNYLNNNMLHITYDFRKLFNNKNYSFREKFNFLLTAYKQKKYKNVEVINPKCSLLIAPTILGVSIILGLFVSNVYNKITNKKDNSVIITNDTEITSEEVTSVITEQPKTREIEQKEENIISEDTNTILEQKEEFKINDNYKLDNMILKYSFDNEDPKKDIKTQNLNCKYYKTQYIAIINGNQILDFRKASEFGDQTLSSVVSNFKSELGENIEIFVNYDGYGENNNKILSEIGWANLVDLNVKSEDTLKEKIIELELLKDELRVTPQEKGKIKVKTNNS